MDHLATNIANFIKGIMKVLKANPTGVSEDQKVNMAIVIHVRKINMMSHWFHNFEPNDWIYC
jgi:hypothetical protein